MKEIKLALINNWRQNCGISSYTKYLIDELYPKISELKIFSEINPTGNYPEKVYDVDYCWKRGTSMTEMSKKILSWKPNVILIQHEFGLFPKSIFLLKLLEDLSNIPVVVTMHSVYRHLDKSLQSAAFPNIIVHNEIGKNWLRELGHTEEKNKIWKIDHGCLDLGEVKPNFNSTGSPYSLMQFGFGFQYKGGDLVLEALSLLKKRHKKFEDIFYLFLCSSNDHTNNIHNHYYKSLKEKAQSLGVAENFSIQRGYFSDNEINNYLRTTRLSVFFYSMDEKNPVAGASGAIRIAMANGNPVIASSSAMFSDLEGVLPRPKNVTELADCIAKSFSDGNYRKGILERQRQYILNNTWNITADRYKKVLEEIQV